VADLIGADPKEIIFTSGATESNNLALKGVANFYKERKNHIITTQTDHKCVLDSARYLQQRGFEVGAAPPPALQQLVKGSVNWTVCGGTVRLLLGAIAVSGVCHAAFRHRCQCHPLTCAGNLPASPA
jgi:Aminotransferase class-V